MENRTETNRKMKGLREEADHPINLANQIGRRNHMTIALANHVIGTGHMIITIANQLPEHT